MKITFEGQSIHEIVDQMKHVLAAYPGRPNASMVEARSVTPPSITAAAKPQGPGPGSPFEVPRVDKPVGKPLDKPGRTEKQKANDERLRERAAAKKAAGTMFKKAAKETGSVMPVMPTPKPVEPEPPVDPAEVVRIRQKTITDLQEAYANGHQQEVFELLSRFGNGAKSFRELPPEAFVPISEAIAKGALT